MWLANEQLHSGYGLMTTKLGTDLCDARDAIHLGSPALKEAYSNKSARYNENAHQSPDPLDFPGAFITDRANGSCFQRADHS